MTGINLRPYDAKRRPLPGMTLKQEGCRRKWVEKWETDGPLLIGVRSVFQWLSYSL